MSLIPTKKPWPRWASPGVWLQVLRPITYFPDKEVDTLNDLDVQNLKKLGLKTIIIDVDNTICSHNGNLFDQKVQAKIAELKDNFEMVLLSNTRPERKKRLFDYFQIPVSPVRHKKPAKRAFQQTVDFCHHQLSEVAMIGDRYMIDMAAKSLGIYTIKVNPLYKQESFEVKVGRWVENFIRGVYLWLIGSVN